MAFWKADHPAMSVNQRSASLFWSWEKKDKNENEGNEWQKSRSSHRLLNFPARRDALHHGNGQRDVPLMRQVKV
jgi:hypothetical protein